MGVDGAGRAAWDARAPQDQQRVRRAARARGVCGFLEIDMKSGSDPCTVLESGYEIKSGDA